MNRHALIARPAALAALCLGAALAAGCASRGTSSDDPATMGSSAERRSEQRYYPNNMDDPTRATDPRSSAVNPQQNRGGPATGTAVPPGSILP